MEAEAAKYKANANKQARQQAEVVAASKQAAAKRPDKRPGLDLGGNSSSRHKVPNEAEEVELESLATKLAALGDYDGGKAMVEMLMETTPD